MCHDKSLSQLDEELASVYSGTLAKLDDYAKKRLVEEQRSWIKFSRPLCDTIACLHEEYVARIAKIKTCASNCNDLLKEMPLQEGGAVYFEMRNSNQRNQSFQSGLEARRLGKLLGCQRLISLSAGTAGGEISFGALCKIDDGKQSSLVEICDDQMVGNFSMKKITLPISDADIVAFTIKNCYGG